MGAAATPPALAARGGSRHDRPSAAWIEANEDRARFLYMRGHLDWDSPAGGAAGGAQPQPRAGVPRLDGAAPRARRDPPDVDADAHRDRHRAPFTRSRSAGSPASSARRCTPIWTSSWTPPARRSAGRPRAPGSRPRAPARHGRIRLELLSDDGSVIADGEATAELLPRAQRGRRREPRAASSGPRGRGQRSCA